MTTTVRVNYRKFRIRELAMVTAKCVCGHIQAIHGDRGKGSCEGLLTRLDGAADIGPCTCQQFALVH